MFVRSRRRHSFLVATISYIRSSHLVASEVSRRGVSIIACLMAFVGLLGGGAFGALSDSFRKIVVFQDGTSAQVQQQVVARSGSQLLNFLALVNGATIELPPQSAAQALTLLEAEPTVVGIYADLTISAQDGGGDTVIAIAPADPPSHEDLIRANQQLPQLWLDAPATELGAARGPKRHICRRS